jgi:thiol:disulfide interchange protein/DsbC/DsbD-like thiol-disulfide interchange protein
MASVAFAANATAQQPKLDDILTGKPLAGPVATSRETPETVISVRAHFTRPNAAGRALLEVTAQIKPGWHIYSLSQKPVKAEPTTIVVDESRDFRLLGTFRPNLPPQVVRKDGDVFEQHAAEVSWQAPIEIKSGLDPRNLKIVGRARIQTCRENACLQPHSFAFTAGLSDAQAAPASVGTYSDANHHITLTGRLEPPTAAPGGQVKLVVEAEPAQGWHVYELANRDTGALGYKPTLIVLTNTSGFPFSRTIADNKAVEGESVLPGEPPQRYHDGRVAWTTVINIPKDARPGQYPIAGTIGYQVCTGQNCDLPRGARFEGTLVISAAGGGKGTAPLTFSDAKYGEAARLAETHNSRRVEIDPIESPSGGDLASLPMIILAGLLGGFILNFMPCVLPVIGLKILSFAEQAGRSRAQILALNAWYALGVLSVFMVLAALASGVSLGLSEQNLGWGQQFSSTWFNIVMVGIVFVMALSFLGVWEIPIPGFVNTGAANDLAAREGATGAFAKGVLATILSTPCSGPFLGPVLGFTLKQPPVVTFVVFGAMGLGMAAPYLLIGAFPRLIRFLPKPGAWMETFKHMMGFVLLGTIVFLFTFMDRDYLVPTFAMIVGLWAACWWIGRVSLAEPLSLRLKTWAQGVAFATIVGAASFHWLTPQESLIAWKNFSQVELDRLTGEGHTVLVDFTADWCLTCKVNLATAIETDDVKRLIDQNKVVPMLADWTKGSDEIKQALESVGSNSIPVLAVFPSAKPKPPIVLRDLVTKQQVLDAITQAGPSKAGSKALAVSTMP